MESVKHFFLSYFYVPIVVALYLVDKYYLDGRIFKGGNKKAESEGSIESRPPKVVERHSIHVFITSGAFLFFINIMIASPYFSKIDDWEGWAWYTSFSKALGIIFAIAGCSGMVPLILYQIGFNPDFSNWKRALIFFPLHILSVLVLYLILTFSNI